MEDVAVAEVAAAEDVAEPLTTWKQTQLATAAVVAVAVAAVVVAVVGVVDGAARIEELEDDYEVEDGVAGNV